MKAFKYQFTVGFEDTNLVGNVYFANHIRWQGRCREQFLATHTPEIANALQNGLALVTLHTSCDYLAELKLFDTVTLHMYLDNIQQNRVEMRFAYWCDSKLIARGRHIIACMKRETNGLVPTQLPDQLRSALLEYS